MGNVKLGFQIAIGWYLGKAVMSLPAVIRDPAVQKQWERVKLAIANDNQEATPVATEPKRTTSAFPQCKNIVGFTTE